MIQHMSFKYMQNGCLKEIAMSGKTADCKSYNHLIVTYTYFVTHLSNHFCFMYTRKLNKLRKECLMV